MGASWYAIVVLSIFYISWRAIVVTPPLLKEKRKAKYHYVQAGIFCTLGQLAFIFLLSTSNTPMGTVLPLVCFFTWMGTLSLILLNSSISVFTRRFSFLIIIAVTFILLLYPNGVHGFLLDADNFSAMLVNRASASEANSGKQISSNSTKSSEESTKELKDENSSTGRTKESSEESAPTTITQTRVSHILKAIFFFIQSFLVINYFGKMWYYSYQNKIKEGESKAFGEDSADQVILTLSIAISSWVAFVLLGFDTLSVSVFSGLVAVGASVALRDLLGNFVAGALLIWERTIKVGDVISIDKSRSGQVKDITMRYMIVQDRNDIEYLIPHSQLVKSTVENWTRGKKQVRLKLDIGVAYGSPLEKVKDIMSSVCFEVPRVLKSPLPNPLIMSMGDSAINFQLRFRIADPENGIRNVMSDVYERLLKRFEAANIEIPYPQREIRIRKSDKIDTEITSSNSD